MNEEIKNWLDACPDSCFLIELEDIETINMRLRMLQSTQSVYTDQENLYAVIKFKDLMEVKIG